MRGSGVVGSYQFYTRGTSALSLDAVMMIPNTDV